MEDKNVSKFKKLALLIISLLVVILLFVTVPSNSTTISAAEEYPDIMYDDDAVQIFTTIPFEVEQGRDYTIYVPDLVVINGLTYVEISGNNGIMKMAPLEPSPSINGYYELSFTAISSDYVHVTVMDLNQDGARQYVTFYGYEDLLLIEGLSVDTEPPKFEGDGIYFSDVNNPASLEDIQSTLSAYDDVDSDLTEDIYIFENEYFGNEDTLGDYDITFRVEDSSGNQAETVITVRVVDITPPEIEIIGDSTIYLEVHDSWDDPGFIVTDNYDDEVTDAGWDGTVDTSTVGKYEIVYQAMDSSGNYADPVTRTVIVQDTTAPEIALNGDSTIYLEVHDTWNDLGAIVTDNYDDDLSYDITGSVDTSTLGTYTLSYDAVDSSGNQADTVTRTIIVQDTTPPVITLNGDSTIYIEYGDSYEELGATVTDNYDSNLDVVISGTVDESTLGEYILSYDATDSSGNQAATVTRTVIVQNTTAPEFDLPDHVEVRNTDNLTLEEIMAIINVEDSYDGDLSGSIEVIEDNYTANIGVVGQYDVTLQATNQSGVSSTATFTIIIRDSVPPSFTLSDYIIPYEDADNMTQEEIRNHINNR